MSSALYLTAWPSRIKAGSLILRSKGGGEVRRLPGRHDVGLDAQKQSRSEQFERQSAHDDLLLPESSSPV
jgi:hypothetical protein